MRENILLADCEEAEVSTLLQGLNTNTDSPFVCVSYIANGQRTGIISELIRYAKYFTVPWKIFINRRKYGIIAGWQQFYALVFCFYCSLFRVKKCNTVLAINFTYKPKGTGLVGKIYDWFMGKCVGGGYLDYIHVLSEEYADNVSGAFGFPRENVLVSPFGIDDIFPAWEGTPAPNGYKPVSYALAIGRSNRDYDFLIQAWASIEHPLVIISDTYKPGSAQLPGNVRLLNNISGDAQYPWIVNAKIVILPIADGNICSGDTVLLTAMSFARTVMVTVPSTLGEMYIRNGENGYLVEKNIAQIRMVVNNVFDGKIRDLSDSARASCLKEFTRESMGHKLAVALQSMKKAES